ncbi:C6orf62 [Bugula neritina]|uniref:C6orf62 n=1 Tax=Bugula neritina TaxID=10212 RepID=A0A7J7KF94_BUGNE|nr:C6orf62 [Bugula neritina]
MANFSPRKDVAAARLRNKLRRNRESLADQFEFKMFVVIDFKVQSKKTVIFEVDKVYPMMTNDYEEKMTKEMEKSEFSKESSLELLAKDVVQLHARNWHCKRRDVVGCSEQVDFMIWPRNDVQSIRCHLFSRWKHETKSPFKPCMASFSLSLQNMLPSCLGIDPPVSKVLVSSPTLNKACYCFYHNAQPLCQSTPGRTYELGLWVNGKIHDATIRTSLTLL